MNSDASSSGSSPYDNLDFEDLSSEELVKFAEVVDWVHKTSKILPFSQMPRCDRRTGLRHSLLHQPLFMAYCSYR